MKESILIKGMMASHIQVCGETLSFHPFTHLLQKYSPLP